MLMPTLIRTWARTQVRSTCDRPIVPQPKNLQNNSQTSQPHSKPYGFSSLWLAISGCMVLASPLITQPSIAAITQPDTRHNITSSVIRPGGDRSQNFSPSSPQSSPQHYAQRILERETLTLGSQGETVRELQAILYLLGYYQGEVSGIFSPATAQAVRSFQVANRLQADGIVGSGTWGTILPLSLDTATSTETTTTANTSTPTTATPDQPRLQLGDDDLAVFLLQQRLSLRGYYRGAIDGHFGPVTQAAVISVQRDAGLPATGVVDGATWTILLQD